MRPKDIILVLLCCVIWGANIPVTRWAMHEVPPLFLAFLRFFFLTIVLSPFLRPVPRELPLVFLISICIGSLNFVFLYLGLKHSSAGLVSIIGQLGLPLTLFLSVIFLSENLSSKQLAGIILAFFGVMIVLFRPMGIRIEIGVPLVIISTLLSSIGTILMKRMKPISSFQLQAWVGAFSILPLIAASLIFEGSQISALSHTTYQLWIAVAFSVLGVSVFGHSSYYSLVKKYDVSRVLPYTVTTPIWAVIISNQLLNEQLSAQFIIGSVICLAGIMILSFDFGVINRQYRKYFIRESIN